MPTDASLNVVTGPVRLSYAFLFEPRKADDDSDPKYSTVILIPKSDKKTLRDIQGAIDAAAEAGKNTKFEGKIPKNLSTTLHDGDEEADLEENPEYEGHMYMNIASKVKPGLVDANVNPIMDQTELYSGCYARVAMRAYAYSYKGKKGVSFGLNHVQKVSDGEPLGGRTRAEDVFQPVQDDSDSLI